MKDSDETSKIYSKLLSDDFNSLNLKNIPYFTTNYILRCVEGEYEGNQIRLSDNIDELIIGSGNSSSLVIRDDELSAKHCKISPVSNTIYYTLEDMQSESGTWKRVSFFDEPMEITETTVFKVFQNTFTIEITQNTMSKEVLLRIKEGNQEGSTKAIEEDSVEVGKKDCMYELNMSCNENHLMKIQKVNGRAFVTYLTPDVTNEGFFYKIQPKQKVLIRAEDCFKIRNNTFR